MRSKERIKGSFDKALEALKEQDNQETIAHITKLNDDLLKVHDRLVLYINHLLSFISEEVGEESVRDAWRYVLERVHKRGFLKLKERPHEEVVQVLLNEHMAHGSDLSIEEEEGKTTIVLHCCGSGGRLRKREGTPAPGPTGQLKEKRSWGFGRPGISYYCSHCSIVSEDSPGWDAGHRINVIYGEQFDGNGKSIDKPCKFEIITL
jgi:hypothetical protein